MALGGRLQRAGRHREAAAAYGRALEMQPDLARGMAGQVLEPYARLDLVVGLDQGGLARLDHRPHAVGDIVAGPRQAGVAGELVPVLPLDTDEQVRGVRAGRHPR